MKRIALFFSAALLAAPVFAADLCTVNMQKLDDSMATHANLASPLKEQVAEHKKAAEAARAANDLETCGTHAQKALQLLEAPGDNGEADAG
ncbi:MAG: hypothetical protein ABWY06_20800 [Pseudomonas sp.]|uniref:hypothetical protein n=1 Tax=Pseudomonas sp. TaxID=306 RepID=UPI003396098D